MFVLNASTTISANALRMRAIAVSRVFERRHLAIMES